MRWWWKNTDRWRGWGVANDGGCVLTTASYRRASIRSNASMLAR